MAKPLPPLTTSASVKAAAEWKEYALELQELLDEANQRLAEIADIANPEAGEREERFDKLVRLLDVLITAAITTAGPMLPEAGRKEIEAMLAELKPKAEEQETPAE